MSPPLSYARTHTQLRDTHWGLTRTLAAAAYI